MTRPGIRRLLARTTLIVVSAGLLVAGAAGPASAYSCANGQAIMITQSQNISSANVTFYPKCSDNKAHFSGWIHDIAATTARGDSA